MTDSYDETLIVHHRLTKLKDRFIWVGILTILGGLCVSLSMAMLQIGFAWIVFQLTSAVGVFLLAATIGIMWVCNQMLPD